MVDLVSAGGSVSPAREVPTSTSIDFLSLLSPANRRRLLMGSTRAVHPAGSLAYQPHHPPMAFLIESGVGRAYWSLPDGRQATIGILRPNELSGASAINGYAPSTYYRSSPRPPSQSSIWRGLPTSRRQSSRSRLRSEDTWRCAFETPVDWLRSARWATSGSEWPTTSSIGPPNRSWW